MGFLEKLFGSTNVETSSTISNKNYSKVLDNSEDDNQKTKCPHCSAMVNVGTKFCWKCGKPLVVENVEDLNSNVSDKNEGTTILEKKKKEPVEYKYPNLDDIKNEKLKEAIENISNSGIINLPIGLDSNDKWMYYDITKMPNLLIGGTVMSGKTNLINSLLISILSKYSPEQVKIIIADSKGVDYACYNGVPHLLMPVIRNAGLLQKTLQSEIFEMNKRYSILNSCELKKVSDFNKKEDVEKIPYHIIFIDDYTIFTNGSESDCNACIEDLAQNGWNVGIHLVMIANHPTVNVLSAISLLNFPSRLSFRVPSIKDSRMILEATGAEKITDIGNALINTPLIGKVEKIHTLFIEDDDILSVIKDIKDNNKAEDFIAKTNNTGSIATAHGEYEEPLYDDIVEYVISTGRASVSILQGKFKMSSNRAAHAMDLLEKNGVLEKYSINTSSDSNFINGKELYDEVVDFVIKTQKASASLLQRKFKIGYSMAAAMIDRLEEDGIISPAYGNSKPRDVLVQYKED